MKIVLAGRIDFVQFLKMARIWPIHFKNNNINSCHRYENTFFLNVNVKVTVETKKQFWLFVLVDVDGGH